jgi:hypothetical protein
MMFAVVRRKGWLVALGAIAIVLGAGAIIIAQLNPRLTHYVESDAFRSELEKETAKGLHFPSAHYSPIRRTDFLTASSDAFRAEEGRKALRSIDARGISTKFNPWGVFLRRWQLDDLHIDSGEVGIQTYTPQPEPSPPKAWFRVFLPERVYLKRVWSDPVDVIWRLRGQKAGFIGTRLLITPHGRDFEYQATGGTLKMPLMPDLELRHTHLLINNEALTLYQIDLAPRERNDGIIHGEGRAGTREDKSVDFKVNFDKVPVEEWLPATWKDHFSGWASGNLHWTGKNPKLESSSMQGRLQLHNGRVVNLLLLENLAVITKKKGMERLELRDCSFDIEWNYPSTEIRNIAIEDAGKLRIEGSIAVRARSLTGSVQLGVAREYLEWLPHAEEVFTREAGGYLWTIVHLSGTIDEPQQDLSPRIVEVLKELPEAFLTLVFRQLGDWFKNAFEGE